MYIDTLYEIFDRQIYDTVYAYIQINAALQCGLRASCVNYCYEKYDVLCYDYLPCLFAKIKAK